MKTLLLWDIDGTLIASGGAGLHALSHAMRDAFGIEGSLSEIPFAGRTDTWIIRQIFQKFGIADTPANLERCITAYLERLPAQLALGRGHVLPGVVALLEAATARGDVVHGLLTGNIRRGAELKLEHYGLSRYFAFGAFGDDSELRHELGPHALRRARDHHAKEFAGADVWIIGDTPHDIACGKAIGARTLAVATGNFTVAQLAACEPTAVREHLGATAELLAVFTS